MDEISQPFQPQLWHVVVYCVLLLLHFQVALDWSLNEDQDSPSRS